MTLRHLDFPSGQPGLYGTNLAYMDDGIYGQIDHVVLGDDPDPSITGNVPKVGATANGDGMIRFILPSSQYTVGMGCRIYLSNIPTGAGDVPYIHQYRDPGNSVLVTVAVNPTGGLTVYRGENFGTVLGSTSGPVLVANSWQHVESKVFASDTVGTVEIRVEGVVVLSLTVQNTSSSGFPIAQVANSNEGGSTGIVCSYYVKDLAIWDSAGSVNNDFLGSIQVHELTTNSDTSFNWAASTGTTGYNLLDEAPPNDDTDYIYAVDPAPAASTFGLTNLPADVTSVKGIYTVVRSRKTDGGDGNLQVGLISNGDTGLGLDRPITTAYTYWADMFELDPDTSTSWSPSAVDAVTLQLNRTV